ncbi:MAG: hypothetical protein SNG35_03265 [Rikenellaceae bacterium]
MKRIVNIATVVVVWVLFGVILTLLIMREREYSEQLDIRSLSFVIHGDESPHAQVDERGEVNERSLLNILDRNSIKLVGSRAYSVNFGYVESLLEGNGFVERAECYINRGGDMTIEVWRRDAAMRLMLDGYNCYLSYDGLLFDAPVGSPILTHLVTGSYRPLFYGSFRGSIDDYTEERIEQIDRRIEAIEVERYPILKRQRENDEQHGELRKRYINRRLLESEDEFDVRVAELRESNQRLRSQFHERSLEIKSELSTIDKRIRAERLAQKKLRKKCEDMYNLLIFVETINDDPFWRSEIVQIVLKEGSNSTMRIELMVRSGSFKVVFGSLDALYDFCWSEDAPNWSEIYDEDRMWSEIYAIDNRSNLQIFGNEQMIRRRGVEAVRREKRESVRSLVEERLDRLRGLYNDALVRVGWDRYREINIEFKSQVVCR